MAKFQLRDNRHGAINSARRTCTTKGNGVPMRVLYETAEPRMKISVFSFNEKWIVKVEAGLCEQTYKFPQDEYSLEDVKRLCERGGFRDQIHSRFLAMHAEMQE